jgi:hypothetical protein
VRVQETANVPLFVTRSAIDFLVLMSVLVLSSAVLVNVPGAGAFVAKGITGAANISTYVIRSRRISRIQSDWAH